MARPRVLALVVAGALIVGLRSQDLAWAVARQSRYSNDLAAAGGSRVALRAAVRTDSSADAEGGLRAAESPVWIRAALASLAAVLVLAGAGPARAVEQVNLYLGQGCFWHLQHEVVTLEEQLLGRSGKDLTALVGYAGGNKVGDKGQVCYHNRDKLSEYHDLGHTEVVNVQVPEDKIGAFAAQYFDDAASYPFGRRDPQDFGPEYRSAIGIPGGVDGPYFEQVKAANAGRMTLVSGKGNDADTVGTKKVWVYDSNKFSFNQGEVYHQFHDDMGEKYGKAYHELKGVLRNAGKINKVTCPDDP